MSQPWGAARSPCALLEGEGTVVLPQTPSSQAAGGWILGAHPPSSKLLVPPPRPLGRLQGCFWDPTQQLVYAAFPLILSLIFCSNPAVPGRRWEWPCSEAEPGQPHWAATAQAWARGKEEPWNTSWSQLLQRRMLQEPGPWRHREDLGGFARHHPNQYLTLEEKHHQLEQPPLLPGSQAPPEHMESAGREHEERVVGLRHRRRGGCHSCSHPRTAHCASGASEVARRQRLGSTPNPARLPGMLQRCPILWTSVLVMDREHVGWSAQPSHRTSQQHQVCSHLLSGQDRASRATGSPSVLLGCSTQECWTPLWTLHRGTLSHSPGTAPPAAAAFSSQHPKPPLFTSTEPSAAPGMSVHA